MGVFGIGLYSGDFAMDLRAAVVAVSRLPFDGDRLVEILRQLEPRAAEDPEDEDHTTFWLVLADQFAKRGIAAEQLRKRAVGIIESGSDLEMLKRLGMAEGGLRKRGTMLRELRGRLLGPSVEKARMTLKKPQPYLMEIGDVLVYPTAKGHNINPYFSKAAWEKLQAKHPWTPDGWGAMVIVDRGRAFDFLTWYRPIVMVDAVAQCPDLGRLRVPMLWRLETPGTCSSSHLQKMRLEQIGTVPISGKKLEQAFGVLRPGTSAAISDISIANRMSAAPHYHKEWLLKPGEATSSKGMARTQTISELDRILEG